MLTPFLALLALVPQAPVEQGFTSLFDGKTLTGWTEKGGRYDGDAVWTIEDGCIVGRQGPNGEGGLLYTEKAYSCFELRLDVKLDHPFDSGVFLRMVPPSENRKGAQVTLDWRDDGQIGALYSDGYVQENPEGAKLFKKDEWNELVVRCTGFDLRVEAVLNGKPLVDCTYPAERFLEFAPRGLIGLQVHGARGDTGAARFRNVRLRELPVFGEETVFSSGRKGGPGLAVNPRGQELGWKPLFNGNSLDGWQAEGDASRYRAYQHELQFLTGGDGGHLFTTKDYQDFELRFDFNIARMANSGLFLRATRDGANPAFSGCEVQILDDFNWESVTQSTLKPWQFTGSLYGSVPAGKHGVLRPPGEWNSYEVLYKGTRLAVALNGHILYDVDTATLKPEQGEPFTKRAKQGFIGLQHHGSAHIESEVLASFRDVLIREL